jgi:Flp pilus assembly protein TadD
MMFRVLLIFSLWLAAIPLLPAETSTTDPSEQFLSAYQSYQQGENLERAGNTPDAINKYRFAESLLASISKNNPSWQKPVIEYRLKKTRESIDRLQGAGSSTDGGSDTTLVAPPAAVADQAATPPTPSDSSSSGPSISIVPPTKTSATADSGNAGAASSENRRLRRMIDDLRAQLQEATDALTSQKHRVNDLENADWVKKRSQLTSDLDVANRRISDLESDLKSRDSWGQQLKDLQKKLDDSVADKLVSEEQYQGSIKKLDESNVSLMKQLQDAQHQVAVTEGSNKKVEELQAEVEKGKESLSQLQAKLDHSEQVAKDSLAKNDDLQKQIAEVSEKMIVAQKRAADAEKAAAAAKAIQSKILADADADRAVLQEEQNSLIAKLTQSNTSTLADLKNQLAENSKKLDESTAKLSEAQQAASQANDEAQRKAQASKGLNDLLAKQNGELQDQLKTALGEISASVDHTPEASALKLQMKQLQDQLDQGKKDYAEAQQKIADLSNAQPDQSKALQEKEKALAQAQDEAAKLQSKLTDAGEQIQSLKKKSESGENRLKELQDQLAERDAKIAHLKKKKGNAADEQAAQENDLLRGIVIREIKDEAKKAQAHRLMEEELKRLNVQSDVLQQQMGQLASPAVELTPQERALFKDAELVVIDSGGSTMEAAISAPMNGGGSSNAVAAAAPATDTNPPSTNAAVQESKSVTNVPSTPESQGKLKDLLAAAKEQFDRQDFLQAESTFQEALKISPNDYFALSNLGVVEFQLGKMGEAEIALKKAADQSKDNSFALTTLGIVHYRQQRLQDAETVLRKSVAINDQDFTAHNYLGIVLAASGKGKAGESEIMRSIEINPKYADAHFNLAVIYATGKPPAKMLARKHYDAALQLGSPPDQSLENLIK